MKKRPYSRLTEKSYNEIKMFTDQGMATSLIIKHLELTKKDHKSPSTINRIKKSKNFEDYQQIVTDFNSKQRKQKPKIEGEKIKPRNEIADSSNKIIIHRLTYLIKQVIGVQKRMDDKSITTASVYMGLSRQMEKQNKTLVEIRDLLEKINQKEFKAPNGWNDKYKGFEPK